MIQLRQHFRFPFELAAESSEVIRLSLMAQGTFRRESTASRSAQRQIRLVRVCIQCDSDFRELS
jgi:hypothetical protein